MNWMELYSSTASEVYVPRVFVERLVVDYIRFSIADLFLSFILGVITISIISMDAVIS